MCQKDINTKRPSYNALCCTGQQIIQECKGSLGEQAISELDKVTRRWVMITNRVTTNQQQLELSLKDWQEYTSLTENLMVWLREKEKLVRAQSKASTVRELKRELDAKKVVVLLHIYEILGMNLMFMYRYVTTELACLVFIGKLKKQQQLQSKCSFLCWSSLAIHLCNN